MGTPFFILATGQSNMAAAPAYTWSPSSRAKVWNNTIDNDTSIGSSYDPVSGSTVNVATRYASKIAEADAAKDVYVAVYARNGRDISYWFGGCQYAYPGLGAGQMALSSTPEVTTQIFVSIVDILGIRRPYSLADLRVGEFMWVSQGASSYKFLINGIAASDTNGVTLNVAYISGSGGVSPGTVQVEFQPRFLYEIENSVPAALAAAGASTVDLVMWWQGESDAENNTRYNTEFEFVIGYLQQKSWWGANTKLLICGMNSTANNGMPSSDVQNARFASLAAASSNRYFMNSAALLSPSAWADVYHMTPIGYAAAGDLAMSIYAPAVLGGGGGGGGAVTITSMSAGAATMFLDVSGRPEHQLIDGGRTGYGLWIDGPLRPYRDNTGTTYVPIMHSENYRYKVTSWASSATWELQGPVMLSARQQPQGLYNNRHWVWGIWSTGSTIYGLTHHEWYNRPYTSAGVPGFNALNYTGVADDFNKEWVNGISLATSTDGGATFVMNPSTNSSKMALIPEPWEVQSARHMFGFFHPSNIVKEGNYYYSAVEQRSVVNASGNAVGGVSLIRTLNPSTPLGWEFWGGSSWIVVDHNYYQGNLSTQIPYRFFEKVNNYYATGSNSTLGLNLRYHVPSSTWIMLGYTELPQGLGYSTSPTLASPQFTTVVGITSPDPSIYYPYTAVFDEAASDANYQNINGNTATLIITDNTVSRVRKATLTINVSSSGASTYSVAPATTSVNEGSTVTFNLATTGVGDGTVLYWTNAGTTSSADFTDGLMSGSFAVASNSGYFSRTLVSDATTEGPETIVIEVRTGSISGTVVATAATVTVNDTSVPATPTYAVTPSASTVDEGASVTFNVTTTNVANGTLYWTNAGTTNSADFTDGLMSGSFALANNTGSITRSLVNDSVTEGAESIVIQIRVGSVGGTIVATSTAVTVNDTSTGTAMTYSVSPSVSAVNEGSTVTFNVATTSVPNGTILYWTNSGTTSGADFTDGLNAGSLVINNNSGAITRTLTNDGLTEGLETIVVQIRTGSTAGPIVATASTVTVNDTSTPGVSTAKLCFRAPQGTWLNGALTTALKFRTSASAWIDKSATLAGVMVRNAANSGWVTFSGATYSVAPSAGTVNAGSSVTYTITTTNFGSGTLYWDLAGSALSSDFTDGAITGTVAITNNGGTFTRSVSNTATDARTIILRLRKGSVTGPVVATASTVTISAIPTAPSALTMNRNNLDFYYYTQPVSPTANGYLDIQATVDTSSFFNYATGSIDHIVFAFDATGGQGSYNPHCGPIIRNGRNLWALARGVLLTRSGDVIVEEWNGTFSPFTAVIPNALGGGPLNVLSGVYTVRIRAGYVQSSVWTNTIYVSVHAGSSIYDTAIFQGSANGRNFNVTGSSSVAIAAISMGFVNPSDTGCVEKTGAGPAYGGVLPFTLDAYAY